MPIVLVLFILLWPVALSDLPAEPAPTPAKGAATPPALQARRPQLARDGLLQLNREAFLASFERQARAALLPCLKSLIAEKGQALLMARLHRSGALRAGRVLAPDLGAPECVRLAMEQMSFDPRNVGLEVDNLELEWRYEW